MANGVKPPSGITDKERETFATDPFYSQYFGGRSPAAATQAEGADFGGPRFSAFFNPSGYPYSSLSSGEVVRHQIIDQFNLQRGLTDAAYSQARAGMGDQLGRVGAGFEEARGYLSTAGNAARRRALEREQQVGAQFEARAGGRGYAADFALRGLAADTTRALVDIDQQIAQMFSGLAIQQTGIESGIMGALSSSYLDQASTYQSLLTQQFSLLGGHAAAQAGGRDNSPLYELLGSLAETGGYIYGASQGGGGSTVAPPGGSNIGANYA